MKLQILSLALLIVAKAAALAGVDLGSDTLRTPYDAYMSPVKTVLGSISGVQASMDQAEKLMRIGRNFRYVFDDPYRPAMPSVTAASRSGDCKDKALWLCDQLGDANVRFVIGKARSTSKISHAWVMWKHDGRWFVLDPTNTNRPLAADRLSSREYIPLYSYGKDGVYRHKMTSYYAAKVAGRNKPVASARN